MKKLSVIICLLCTFVLSGCDLIGNNSNKNMKNITASDVLKKLDRDDNTFLLYLTADQCYSCDEYKKVIEGLQAETPFDIYYLNVNEEDVDKMEELKIRIGDYTMLPMTYYFEKGELIKDNIKSGYIEAEQLKEWLRQLKIIN